MLRRYCRILIAVASIAVMPFVSGCATTAKEPLLSEQQRQLNLDSFDYVWSTIRDKHFDPQLGGLDWQEIRDEFRPQVAQASTMSQARGPMAEMIMRLGQSHFSIIPSHVYENMEQPESKSSIGGVTGIDVRVVDLHAVVTSVEEGSPAAELGVQPGWEVVHVGEYDVVPKLKVIAEEFEDKTWKESILSSVVLSRMRGRVGDEVTATFLDSEDQTVELTIPLAKGKGRKMQFGHLPPLYIWTKVDLLADNIGYIAFNLFLDPANVMPAYNQAMQSFMSAQGIIIDIRGNGGGLPAMAMGMAGWLIAEKNHRLGTMYTRDNELKIIVYPRATVYDGPVVVLVDGMSGSASEIFAGGLKDLGRTCIVGTRTCGAALPSAIEKLPNGDGFQYAFANYISQGGEVLEGIGVIPDIEVSHTREALLQGKDLPLETAIAWIKDQHY